MKASRQIAISLVGATSLLSKAIAAPHWTDHSENLLEKRASRVAYAGVNIAGCEFGIDTNVSSLLSTLCIE